MTSSNSLFQHESPAATVADAYHAVRSRSRALAAPLSAEDACVQSMPDASPAKWHLAHTTWFFERFILAARAPDYRVFDERFDYLFNSYYYTAGQMHARSQRGLVTRPSLAEVLDYRSHVDAGIQSLLEREQGDDELAFLVTLGINHEQQHQELLLTDIKHLFAQNPLLPAYADLAAAAPAATDALPAAPAAALPLTWVAGRSGRVEVGHDGHGFAFDNEGPRHEVLLREHALASRLVTNAEFREFIDDGGYAESSLWLSDGWSTVLAEGWNRPLYWQEDLEQAFTLGGLMPIEADAPVTHLSLFEADAFARWAGCRLPTEFEWEVAARDRLREGNWADSGTFRPQPATPGEGLRQLYGDAWEWTASPYTPYPGFQPLAGSLGEYNGKFMCSQMVLRGGSCATPAGHVRPTYRNFFYPGQRWQFSGVRLARDGS
ncbi:ergothioneine biosynthesis protein EgtB [Wenzhouxiangella sp. XN24]|uniref:ergothioneine biosynthesis protein EgtB n=1 Tax=Wenzhouxiangella sp. XN24 TaxID=2713569 RepID=UPI0013EB7401|nr:ergothioneine biosynthesis protein EgtB [Wenzhouxiangella sp. XN24]